MDWKNVNLTSSYERDQDILDPYSFDTLLLEIHCNLPVIDETTVRNHFRHEMADKFRTAHEVFEANLRNIVKQAKKERE
jgi:hypothetical protein